jgi:hypothetical protein
MPEPAAAQRAFGAANRNETANRAGEAPSRGIEPIKRTDGLEDPAANWLPGHKRDRRGPITDDGTATPESRISIARKPALLQHTLLKFQAGDLRAVLSPEMLSSCAVFRVVGRPGRVAVASRLRR